MKKDFLGTNEFLAVRHSVLNGNTYQVESLVEDTLELGRYLPGRRIIPCFEGDLIQVEETGEIVLTHQNFVPLTQARYDILKARKLAASLEEVMDKINKYKQRENTQRVVLCLEPKLITKKATIEETIRRLKKEGLTDVYFDSFYGAKLDEVQDVNKAEETDYQTSLHLLANASECKFMMTRPRREADLYTVPHQTSMGTLDKPVIYGAVGSIDFLRRISQRPEVIGAYVRLSEGEGLKGTLTKLWNSVSNTEKLRQTHLARYA